MSTPAHTPTAATPGPWRVEAGWIRGASDIHTNGREHTSLISSRSFSDDVCKVHGDITLPGPLANARLIAAAPIMAETLQRVRVWLIAPDLSPETLNKMRVLTANVLDKLSQAE